MEDSSAREKKKEHRKRKSGVKAEKKKNKGKSAADAVAERQKNPKAFAINSAVRAERKFRRKEDLTAKKQHIPLVDKTPEEPPPFLIAVVGPPKVGKSTLIRNLIKSFTRTNVTEIRGPITIVTSKKRRITLIECNNDINSMIDIAKCADLVLLMCDASFGFEMEIFEFLNICQVHGMPKIMGVLTHLDVIRNAKTLKRRKKELKHRFWTEVYNGAKLFYLSGILHGEYLRNEVKNLGRFISVMKLRPLSWRGAHSYILADRMEDITSTEEIRLNPKCNRNVVLYGYVRGVPLNKEFMVHIAGFGDIRIDELSALADPCPLPSGEKKRSLLEKERLLYAPMSGVGGLVYDKDAVYIDLQGSHSHQDGEENAEQREIVNAFIEKKETLDVQIDNQEFKLFSDGQTIKSHEFRDDQHNRAERGQGEDPESASSESEDEEAEEEEEEEDSGVEDEDTTPGQGLGWQGDDQESDANVSEESSDDEEYEENSGNLTWREGLAQKARDAYLDRQANSQNVMKLVYGVFSIGQQKKKLEQKDDDDEEGSGDDLFGIVKEKQTNLQRQKEVQDRDECCFFEGHMSGLRDWTQEENVAILKNCFVTGKWKVSEDAEELLKLDDLSDDGSEVYGDFEDLETGEKHEQPPKEPEEAPQEDEEESVTKKRKFSRIEEANMSRTELIAKKMKLKEKFDAEYDNPEKDHKIVGDHAFYDNWKAETQRQSELNRSEFATLDDDLRVQIEGFRAGMYVRMSFRGVSYEFVEHFDPTYPILVGSLNMIEQNVGYVTCKVKKHRWYKKLLKTEDPLILSLGWRRFQTRPIYAKIEDNLKHRFLKYTPNHVTCSMTFWGPITPQNTGFLAVQTVTQDTEELKRLGFRIAATGCVTEIDKSTQIMKKLKLVGYPYEIKKNTAFIKDMFNGILEAAKFQGAKIRTVSGIRGEIKKPMRSPEGAVRCTFENKILKSDIVFCRTWFKVDVPKFYAPVTSLMLPLGQKSEWKGMKTLGELKRERNIRAIPNPDNLYTTVERREKAFRPLVIPKSLQRALPYKDKPKLLQKAEGVERVAVIRTPQEQKIAQLMKMIKANYSNKQKKEKEAAARSMAKFKKEKQDEELRKLKKQRDVRRKLCRTMSKAQKSTGKTRK
ncbi:ribosome biogenesis protein BMS1 homolog [Lutzomyia longipalpis]|uniref:ribosome biogenesis protein BMS1 homolog n=1 Tax=Lutzomyia longipalpis TaxID=7200 RepID=UPI0024838ADB|nr:ribosome biogenesis protein BMS1 homolog [Lutzomyia longipalpis]